MIPSLAPRANVPTPEEDMRSFQYSDAQSHKFWAIACGWPTLGIKVVRRACAPESAIGSRYST
jgi:hypothetical protein